MVVVVFCSKKTNYLNLTLIPMYDSKGFSAFGKEKSIDVLSVNSPGNASNFA
jgi:hypothetical protein